MPVVFQIEGWRFHFYSWEGHPREPMHVHVAKAGADAKLWLWPEVHFAYNRGLSPREQRRVLQLVVEHRNEIEEAWNEFFA
ncbi:MAG: hypothetical protein C0515_10900 [Novosphingobium sp.]|nr:hypothetical protein [Novosphingobium sp.]MBS3929286.1 DUF4160 domain-containing protein [Sphingomonadaceae bacterium]MBS3932385.1 DUF4160 domain-containing protein [Sphingomonadales bacterium]MBX9644518.1 DUF4160 domain-containing protein [Novosphingobium sp.]